MSKLRFVFLGAVAAIVLGSGTALADLAANTSATSSRDSHGDAVASAARTTCPKGPDGVHGACVSQIASSEAAETSTEGQENNKGSRAKAVEACRALDTDKTEPHSSSGMTKAQKDADRAEDRAEVKAFVACVTGHTGA
jgi:hypothetical protein